MIPPREAIRSLVGLSGRPAAALFDLAVRARAAAYDTSLLPSHRVEGARVVSVGSLRAGGAGKTPFAIYLARRLRDQGRSVGVVLRGYRGRFEGRGGVVSRGAGPECSAAQAGDEAHLIARLLPAVPVVVGADRVAAVRRAVELGADVVVLDDGYQHRRLRRDLDLLLLGPEDRAPATMLLPAGPLRERDASRADLICGLARDWVGREDHPAVLLDTVAVGLSNPKGTAEEPDRFGGARVYLVSGVARPLRFRETAARAGFDVVGERRFCDHHRFTPREIRSVGDAARAEGAELILTTEKDAARGGPAGAALPWHALRVELEVATGGERLTAALSRALGPG